MRVLTVVKRVIIGVVVVVVGAIIAFNVYADLHPGWNPFL